MLRSSAILCLALSSAASGQALPAGAWQVKSTVVDLDVPGLPGFLKRMATGHSTVERKCVSAGQTAAALLVPDPKARCRTDRTAIADGRYEQVLTCPQKQGSPVTVTRSGTYDAGGFAGRAVVAGSTPKGPMRIAMDQRATLVGGECTGR